MDRNVGRRYIHIRVYIFCAPHCEGSLRSPTSNIILTTLASQNYYSNVPYPTSCVIEMHILVADPDGFPWFPNEP